MADSKNEKRKTNKYIQILRIQKHKTYSCEKVFGWFEDKYPYKSRCAYEYGMKEEEEDDDDDDDDDDGM